jgi:flagellar hook-basal body complex protein FliE
MADFAITGTSPVAAPLPTPPVQRAGAGFGETLGRALAGVNAAQLDADTAASALASGQSVDTAKTLLTVEKANISFQFAMQIRNKLLEAYQEVMRMQV